MYDYIISILNHKFAVSVKVIFNFSDPEHVLAKHNSEVLDYVMEIKRKWIEVDIKSFPVTGMNRG